MMKIIVVHTILLVICNAITITPSNNNNSNASVQLTYDSRSVNTENADNWKINQNYKNYLDDWSILLNLKSEQYGFKRDIDGSSIKVSVDGYINIEDQIDLFFGFGINDQQYLTFAVDLDGELGVVFDTYPYGTGIFVYPACDSTNIASGDVSTIYPDDWYDVRHDLAGGNWNNWDILTSKANYWNLPLTFEFTNNDISDTFQFKFISDRFPNGLICEWKSSVKNCQDFNLFISPDVSDETFWIKSFTVNEISTGCLPTSCPTIQPTTDQPTTAKPTTFEPTTSIPTTAEPTTSDPTTSAPTTIPTTEPTACLCPTYWKLICDHKDVDDGYFSTNLLTTGLENENDPTANTYSIIGKFNNDATLRSKYQDENGRYKFKLIYKYETIQDIELIWTQTSWITESTITDANLTSIPDQSSKDDQRRFKGLALSSDPKTYLDGSDDYDSTWWHAVGQNTAWNGGIPGDYTGTTAYSMSLYIQERDYCDCWELICDHKDVDDGYFSSNLRITGLENEDDPSANTYSIIGLFTNNDTLRSEYQDKNGRYKFKLIYSDYLDETVKYSILIWTQTSWITESTITDANLTLIPDQSYKIDERRFKGLALSSTSKTYLDGNEVEDYWWHSVGQNTAWNGGIPGDYVDDILEDSAATSMSLYIWNRGYCGCST